MNKSRFSVYRIGRSSGVDIQIDDNSVSRVHAELIATQSGSYYLTDCASSGGSYVARRRRVETHPAGIYKPDRRDFTRSLSDDRTRTYRYGRAKGAQRSEGGTSLPKGPVRRNVDTGEIIGEED